MKKSTILIMASVILLGWISTASAAEILGYPIVEKQAKFYTIILGLISASVALVALAYGSFWLADWKKNLARREREGFARELAAAAQPAK